MNRTTKARAKWQLDIDSGGSVYSVIGGDSLKEAYEEWADPNTNWEVLGKTKLTVEGVEDSFDRPAVRLCLSTAEIKAMQLTERTQ